MNTKTFKPMMLALAGAVALAGVGNTYAQDNMADPVKYVGVTTLSAPGLPDTSCTLEVVGEIWPDSGVVIVNAANADVDPLNPTCAAITVENFPWVGFMTGPVGGAGTVTLNTPSALGGLCMGPVGPINYPAASATTTPPGYPDTPASFTIPAGTPFGVCSIQGQLDRLIPR